MFGWTDTFTPSAHRHPRATSPPHPRPPPPHMGTISWRSWKSNSLFQAPILVKSAKLRKHQYENKTGGNWGEKRLSPFICPPPPLFPRSRPYYIFARHTSFLLLKADKQKNDTPGKFTSNVTILRTIALNRSSLWRCLTTWESQRTIRKMKNRNHLVFFLWNPGLPSKMFNSFYLSLITRSMHMCVMKITDFVSGSGLMRVILTGLRPSLK